MFQPWFAEHTHCVKPLTLPEGSNLPRVARWNIKEIAMEITKDIQMAEYPSIKEKGDPVDPRMENLMNEIYYKAYPERKPSGNTKTSSGDDSDSDSEAASGSDSDSDGGKQHSDKESDEERTVSATLGTESTEVPSASTPKDQHTTPGEEEEKAAPSNDEQGT